MRLLIVSPDAYSIFHPETKYIFGGIEIETGHHARGLAELGVHITVATRDHGVDQHVIDGITIVPIPKLYGKGYWEQRQSLAGRIRFRLSGDRNPHKNIEEMMTAVNPDAGYIMGMSPEALALARYCRKLGKMFLFRVAHDKDLVADEAHMKAWAKVSVAEAREVIASADVLLSQTPFQRDELLRVFNRRSELMFPPIELSKLVSAEKKYDVLWIGRNNSFKRPDVFTEIAKALPDLKFCMIFNKVDAVDWEKTVNALPSNVEVIESVPVTEIENYFSASRMFLSTSLHEGFPNTFLQAAKYSVPVVAMGSDPNNMLTQHKAGVLSGDNVSATVNAIQVLHGDGQKYAEVARAARHYAERFNDRKVISAQFMQLLSDKPLVIGPIT